MIDVTALIEVSLLDRTWDDEAVRTAHNALGAFEIVECDISSEDAQVAKFEIETTFDDPEATAETAAYCLREDLCDAGLLVVDAVVIDGFPRVN